MKIKIIFLLLIFYNSILFSSIFDKADWEYQSKRKDIKLFKTKNRFYKVETVLDHNEIEDLVLYLTTRDYYLKIFPNTVEYKKIKKINKNKYLIYEIINFAPFKNRDCIFELEVKNKNNECIIEWYPTKNNIKHDINNNINHVRVDEVYGRWIIKKIKKDKVYISMEYFFDFKFTLPDVVLLNLEKEESFKILNNIKVFLKKEKKLCYKK